jgi:lon-related putative ATP-dependent protease
MAKPEIEAAGLPTGLAPEALRVICDPESLGFETTNELEGLSGPIGQQRAIDAMHLSAQIVHHDFNLFVTGREGSGRHSAVEKVLAEQTTTRSAPFDWVYVNNFDAPHKPRALRLPPGTARQLKKAMQDLVDDLANDIPVLFESEEYQAQKRALEQEFDGRHEVEIAEFSDRARAEEIALQRTPMGFVLTATKDGNALEPEDFEKLEPVVQKQIEQKIGRLQEEFAAVMRKGPRLEKQHRERLGNLHVSMAERAVSNAVNDVTAKLPEEPAIEQYVQAVRRDIIVNAELFLQAGSSSDDSPFPEAIRKFHREPEFDRYAVNIMVSQESGPDTGAPVVIEDLPTLGRLIGRIEHVSQMGALMTNFTLIKPGVMHRANGGFLVLDARRLLIEPFAWDALKRSLQAGAVSITSMADREGLVSTISLEPDPIPLDIRVVLIGDRLLYGLLMTFDPEFRELFKVQADFDDHLPRTKRNTDLFARLVSGFAQANDLKPLTAGGVARLVDHSARLAGDAKRLSLHLGTLDDVMREANHYARQARRRHSGAAEIERAVTEAERRAARVRDLTQEAMLRKTLLIDTSGTAVGQVNGLSVYDLGNASFGRPSRITTRTRMGTGKLIDIEREVELGGPLHSKGVLILSGYLSATYALDVPMSLHASIVFEQSYGSVDGDSASSAELYALLSALSGVPIRQGFAITGSVNQVGDVQAIGGVNEKIEGFFDLCKARRLTGQQGVLIPQSNVDHLMLRPDVVEAVRASKFRVIPVATINAGIEVLTGVTAGKRGRNGAFPDDSINALVEQQLRDFAMTRRHFAERQQQDGSETAP